MCVFIMNCVDGGMIWKVKISRTFYVISGTLQASCWKLRTTHKDISDAKREENEREAQTNSSTKWIFALCFLSNPISSCWFVSYSEMDSSRTETWWFVFLWSRIQQRKMRCMHSNDLTYNGFTALVVAQVVRNFFSRFSAAAYLLCAAIGVEEYKCIRTLALLILFVECNDFLCVVLGFFTVWTRWHGILFKRKKRLLYEIGRDCKLWTLISNFEKRKKLRKKRNT